MIELLRTRRSIRKYENRSIEPETIELLKETLLRAPTSRNFTPWEFVFVDDSDLLEQLSLSKPEGAAFIRNAPLGIVICGNEERSDVWVEDCSIASILVQMTAHSRGLGSCWIQIRNRMHESGISSAEYIRNILGLPDNLQVESIIAAGYPAESKSSVEYDALLHDKIHMNRF